MKKVNIFIVFLFAFASLQLHAQKLSPEETKQLADKSKELHKTGSQNMLEFMSTGDTTFYNSAMSSWQESKTGYQRVMKDGSANKRIADMEATLYDMELSIVDTDLMIYSDYMKNKIASETDKDRTKKVKAGGKEYRVSKYCQTYASSLAKDLK